jgi:hypothetical protein
MGSSHCRWPGPRFDREGTGRKARMRTTTLGELTVAALDVTLTADELAALDPLADQVAGARY